MRPRILVTGAYGHTGRHAVEVLLGQGADVIAAGRKPEALAQLAQETGAQRTEVLDIDDGPALAALAAQADVVVNCAGPMSAVLDKVADAALSAGRHYVDPGGSTAMYERLRPRHDTLLKARQSAVVCSGWIAGVSEMLPRAQLEQARARGERIVEFHGVCGDNNAWSGTASQDIAEFIRRSDPRRQMGYLRRNRWKQVSPLSMWNHFDLPEPVGRQRALRRFNAEFRAAAADLECDVVSANFALMSFRTVLQFARAKRRSLGLDEAVALVAAARARDRRRYALPTFVGSVVIGEHEGRRWRTAAAVTCPDNNRATGAAAAITALMVAEGTGVQRGVSFPCEAVDAQRYIARFTGLGFPLAEQRDVIRE